MAVGYLEHDLWEKKYMGTKGMGKPGGTFHYAVIGLPSQPEVGVGFWRGIVFAYRDYEEEDWYTPSELKDLIHSIDSGANEEYTSCSDLIQESVDEGTNSFDIFAFDNSTEGIEGFTQGVRTASDDVLLGELLDDLQRFWKGVSWGDMEPMVES